MTIPALPGCVTQGETVEEALVNVREAISGYIIALRKAGLAVPVIELPQVGRQELVIK